MGRYNFSAQRVHRQATQLLRTRNNQYTYPPPWLKTIGEVPPAERLARPALQRNSKAGKKSSRIFSPVSLSYKEDELRWEYFNDHPWELARPRVILEDDGRDSERWDWGVELDVGLNRPRTGRQRDEFGRTDGVWERIRAAQAGRPLNGEAVIQRQNWLLTHTNLSPPAAYDQARKELYRVRHAREIEVRVAREEALSTGAMFGPGPLEIGMKLEDKAYEDWKEWAIKEIASLKQLQGSAYTGTESEDSEAEPTEESEAEVQEVAASVPASRRGQTAQGGTAIHP